MYRPQDHNPSAISTTCTKCNVLTQNGVMKRPFDIVLSCLSVCLCVLIATGTQTPPSTTEKSLENNERAYVIVPVVIIVITIVAIFVLIFFFVRRCLSVKKKKKKDDDDDL